MRDDEATLDALLAAVEASPKARERWSLLTAEQVEPLVDWVCGGRTARGRRKRVHDLVDVLNRPPVGPAGTSANEAMLSSLLDSLLSSG